jgi:hypothetical protein
MSELNETNKYRAVSPPDSIYLKLKLIVSDIENCSNIHSKSIIDLEIYFQILDSEIACSNRGNCCQS